MATIVNSGATIPAFTAEFNRHLMAFGVVWRQIPYCVSMEAVALVLLLLIALLGWALISVYLTATVRLARKKRDLARQWQVLEVKISRVSKHRYTDIEDIFQSIATLNKKPSWSEYLAGVTPPAVSFEIVATKGSIRFLIRAERGPMSNSIINFFKGRFGNVDIDIVPDYTQRPELRLISTHNLVLTRPDLFPVKKQQAVADASISSDPLSSYISTVSTLVDGEELWMQVMVEPVLGKWQPSIQRRYKLESSHALGWLGPWEKRGIAFVSKKQPALLVPLQWLLLITTLGGKSPAASAPQENGPEALMREKTQKPVLHSGVRLQYFVNDTTQPRKEVMEEIAQAFSIMGLPETNMFALKKSKATAGLERHRGIRRQMDTNATMYLNTGELALLWHPPTAQLYSPYIHYLESALEVFQEMPKHEVREDGKMSKKDEILMKDQEQPLESQMVVPPHGTCIGYIDNFGKKQPLIIDDIDRRRHVYIIGQTGTGKSTLQEQMILSNIYQGHGVAVVDPHGEMVERLLHYIPSFRKNDVAYFDPADTENPPAFNILSVDKKGRDLIANELIGIFYKMFENSWGPRMEQILFNTIMGLVEAPNATLVDIPAFITTKTFREACLAHCTDEHVVSFWHDQFDVLDPKLQKESVVAVLNKVEKFLNNKIVRGVFAAKRNRFNFDFIMNKQKILLVNLSKGRLSPQNSELIGSMLVSRILVDAMKRIEIPEEERKDFYLYIDEFQNFVSSVSTFESILSEARKYRLNLTIAHQYLAQMPQELRAAIFGNVGTVMALRVGLEDAPSMVKLFGEHDVSEEMLTTLPPFTLFTRSVKNNKITSPLKIRTLPSIQGRFPTLDEENYGKLLEFTKRQYTWNDDDRKAYESRQQQVRDARAKEKAQEEWKKKKKLEGKAKNEGPKPAASAPANPKDPK